VKGRERDNKKKEAEEEKGVKTGRKREPMKNRGKGWTEGS